MSKHCVLESGGEGVCSDMPVDSRAVQHLIYGKTSNPKLVAMAEVDSLGDSFKYCQIGL